MNRRERLLLIAFGAAVAVTALYYGVHYFFIAPVEQADKKIAVLTDEIERLEHLVRSRRVLANRWAACVGRTFSFDRAEASNRLGREIKTLAEKHGFGGGRFDPGTGTRIGAKSGIMTVTQRVTAQGRFANAVAFLKDLYRTPYLAQVTKLSITPVQQRQAGRDQVKLEFTVETPVVPVIDARKIPEAARAECMPATSPAPLPPARDDLWPDEEYAVLARRNIFRPYVPPPQNLVMIDNQDWKTVALKVRFLFEDIVQSEQPETVAAQSQKQVTGKGDVVEIEGFYADGTSSGAKRFDFNQKKDWVYVIAVHSPAPPPKVVDLAVDNQDKNPVDLEVVVTAADGSRKTKPTIRVKGATKIDIDQYEVATLQVTATYASGKPAVSQTFTPAPTKQTYVVPPEPTGVVAAAPPAPVNDPPPDAALVVSGLVTYRGVHEMIASGPSARKVIRAGEEGSVDGGALLAVHPLGGVVKMPSGNYYIYPLGRKFSERVRLDARQETDLPAAIDAWAGQ